MKVNLLTGLRKPVDAAKVKIKPLARVRLPHWYGQMTLKRTHF